ncbi:hypothetical protein F0P96_20815 [Hymenobacter busanensis]|uniref:Uncharacterized protein n=1 Tax=Hymenobacter busanensis TaxID=2607656 RepID=A0AA88FH80_9BACT|nr:hypothetical protein [Hymenobacter busanensis]KAA9325142.1 hypothetical protein F0P96_20815 [Hymenobacter busanensis]
MNRRNTLGITDEELAEYMQVLIDQFTLSWLTGSIGHPLQLLWRRVDELATNELFSLAYSIKRLLEIDRKWTVAQVKLVMSREKNTYQGALFEIFALSMLHSNEHPIKPAKLNQAGFDGILTGVSGKEMRVSIKNYGASKYQQSFEKRAAELEVLVVQLLKKYAYLPCQVVLDFPDVYPEDREWNMLLERLDDMFKQQRMSAEPFSALVEPIDPSKPAKDENARAVFILMIYPFKDKLSSFHLKYQSYTLVITSAYHRNEYKNLFSKLQDACSNLAKHSAVETDNVFNSLFIHLPDSVSLEKAVEWITQYFEMFPGKPISLVLLYQPSVVDDLEHDVSRISNAFKVFTREDADVGANYTLSVPVGRVSDKSSDRMLVGTFADGRKQVFPFYDRYVYQRGKHYLRMTPDGKGGFQGNITRVGSGVYASLVVEIPGQPGSAALSGRFAPSDELLIL